MLFWNPGPNFCPLKSTSGTVLLIINECSFYSLTKLKELRKNYLKEATRGKLDNYRYPFKTSVPISYTGMRKENRPDSG
jgi:hypothetical protein